MDIKQLLINESFTVRDAMQRLSETGYRILLLCKGEFFCGIITDGDIRRYILSGGQITESCLNAANTTPETVKLGEYEKAKEIFVKLDANAVPVLDDEGRVCDIYFDRTEQIVTEKVDIPVVIMAGGLGTRLYPYTKILPKPLIPVGELPIIEHIINRFVGYGCNNYHVIVNHRKEMIKAYLNEGEKPYNLNFVDEDTPLGTAGGLSLLKGSVTDSFFLTNCDILVDANYADIYREHKAKGNVITVVTAFKHIVIPYGVITLAEDGEIAEFSEKPRIDVLTNTGFYLVEPMVVEELAENYKTTMPDIIDSYRERGHKVGVYPIREDAFMDMGRLEELEDMRMRLENGTKK